MTNDRWGSKWPIAPIAEWPKNDPENIPLEEVSGITPEMLGHSGKAWPKLSTLHKQGSNLVDAQAYLYYQCETCNDILDPHTKSFKTLDEKRFAAGWKVKWNLNGVGYKVYCEKCGEKVV